MAQKIAIGVPTDEPCRHDDARAPICIDHPPKVVGKYGIGIDVTDAPKRITSGKAQIGTFACRLPNSGVPIGGKSRIFCLKPRD